MKERIKAHRNFKQFLINQMAGLTGHIDNAGYPFDRVTWKTCDYMSDNENPGWWVYEQTAYWLDGYLRAAIILEDKEKIEYAKDIIYGALEGADSDGFIGPKFLKPMTDDIFSRWPYVVFFRACIALYDYNSDERIIEAMAKHYKNDKGDYTLHRNVLNVEIMLWLYEKTNDKFFLDLAKKSYDEYNNKCQDDLCRKVALSQKKPYAHGVSYNEYSKLGALLYKYTGKKEYLAESIQAFKKIDRYFMLPGGCNCSNEFLISNDYYQSYETCDITDYTWSMENLLKITHDAEYGDKIERCVFNAGMGSITEDFKALQYFSCANQIICNEHSNHNKFLKGNCWMSYRPNPGTECCPGNVNRFMPNYILNSWELKDNAIYSLLHLDGSFEFEINGKKCQITEDDNYPFCDSFVYDVKATTCFDFYFRIPFWAKNVVVNVGTKMFKDVKSGRFYRVKINADCKIVVTFTSEIEKIKVKGGVYFRKGALVYSYPVPEKRIRIEEEKFPNFAAYNIVANGKWAYCIDKEEIEYKSFSEDASFFNKKGAPNLLVSAKEILNAQYETANKVYMIYNLYIKKGEYSKGNFTFTPRNMKNSELKLSNKSETIKLIPYGLCKLRMTVLNDITD